MVQLNRTVIMLLFITMLTPSAYLYAQEVDDLLQSDSGDTELFDDGNAKGEDEKTQYRPKALDTVLLDIQPVNSTEGEAQAVYDAVLETIKLAEDLGEINGRLELGSTMPEMHPMEKCRSIDNKRCIRQTGMDLNARYLIYGSLRDMDDVYLIELELMDVRGGQVLQEVRTQVVKPSTRLQERAAEAACRLTRMYGCEQEETMTGGAVAVAAPMPAAAEEQPPRNVDDESYFDDEEKPATAEEQAPVSDDEADFNDSEKEEAAPVEAVAAQPPAEPEPEQEIVRKSSADRSGTYRILGYTFAGIGAAALVGCATTTALMYMKYDEYNAVKTTDPDASAKAKSKKDDVKTYYWATIGLGIGTVVSGGLSLMFFLLDGSGSGDFDADTSDWSAAPMVSPEAAGFLVNGRF